MATTISDAYLPAPTDNSNGWIKLFRKVHDQYDKKAPFDGNVVYGMASAYTFAQALKNAGDNPSRQDLVNAVEKGGFKGPGLVPYRYSKTEHGGFGGGQIAMIKNGEIVTQGQPMVTDPTSGPIKSYSGGQAQPGDNNVVKP